MVYHEYSHSSTKLGTIRRLSFENIRLTGWQPITMYFSGWSKTSDLADIVIQGLYHNGEPVTALTDGAMCTNEFVRNIVIE